MQKAFAIVVLGTTSFHVWAARGQSQPNLSSQPAASHKVSAGDLPPLPRGKTTVLGGQIVNLDPIRDRFTLKVYGEKPMKIMFDERTQVYRDGSRIPLRELGSSDHASVQTTLDGTDVFAVSIHILSKSPQGDYQGRVLGYNSATGELIIEGDAAGNPLRILVTGGTSIARRGQESFSATRQGIADLEKGALVSVTFESSEKGRGIATQVAILAIPGSEFVFTGDLSSLDLHASSLVLVDPRDGQTYRIFFDPSRLESSRDLHVGQHLRVAVKYDGTRYVASEIAAN